MIILSDVPLAELEQIYQEGRITRPVHGLLDTLELDLTFGRHGSRKYNPM